MSEVKKIDEYLAGTVALADIEQIEVKAGDANFFQVSGGSHFFKVDATNKTINALWLDSTGKLVDNVDGKPRVVAFVRDGKVFAILDRHTDPYNGLSQPKKVEIPTGGDDAKALLEVFKKFATTWFNNLYVPRVEDIEITVKTATPAAPAPEAPTGGA